MYSIKINSICFSEMSLWDIVDGKCKEVTKSIYIHTNIQVNYIVLVIYVVKYYYYLTMIIIIF